MTDKKGVLQETIERAQAALQSFQKDEDTKALKEQQAQRRAQDVAEEAAAVEREWNAVKPQMEALKAQYGDLLADPDFIAGLLAVLMVYRFDGVQLLDNNYHHDHLRKFFEGYRRFGLK